MKKVILLSLIPTLVSLPLPEPIEVCYEETIIELEPKNIQPIITDGDLLTALIFVESRGNDSAIGDRHLVGNEAVGALQIRPIMVKEVNRILKIQGKTERFDLKDRFDRQQSIRMFMVWKNYHHKNSEPEVISRCWNGGPKGYKVSRTEKYWNKVEQQLKQTNG
jgi:hypothetical protein